MKAIKDNIKSILEENYLLRNSRTLFLWNYYNKFHSEDITDYVVDFFGALHNNLIPSIATLERLWRMVQMENPELRGSEWNKRQRQVKPVQKDLGYKVKK